MKLKYIGITILNILIFLTFEILTGCNNDINSIIGFGAGAMAMLLSIQLNNKFLNKGER